MKITVYSTKTCGWCQMLKSWLKEQSIEFTNYSVDENPFAAQMMINLSGQLGVPFSTIEYDDGRLEKIVGFDRQRFESLLTKVISKNNFSE
jgi:glutaredoxin